MVIEDHATESLPHFQNLKLIPTSKLDTLGHESWNEQMSFNT